MRVTFLLPKIIQSGRMRVIFQHANYMHRHGHTITLVVPRVFSVSSVMRRASVPEYNMWFGLRPLPPTRYMFPLFDRERSTNSHFLRVMYLSQLTQLLPIMLIS